MILILHLCAWCKLELALHYFLWIMLINDFFTSAIAESWSLDVQWFSDYHVFYFLNYWLPLDPKPMKNEGFEPPIWVISHLKMKVVGSQGSWIFWKKPIQSPQTTSITINKISSCTAVFLWCVSVNSLLGEQWPKTWVICWIYWIILPTWNPKANYL